jgi:alkanesulfonate monooxygenase SsuD/methylene tetrahydromethanopterin reductase-like flavin-dependent oxidoreductase (luciferase family)
MREMARAAGSARTTTFGLGLFTGQHPTGGPPLYRQALDLARAAEDAGFDTFWTSEHHGLADGYLPSPLTLLAAVAARTSRIRLASGLATAPLYHPVRLAEDAAVVDQISEGRLTLGLGLGYSQQEYETFGVPTSSRGARLSDLLRFLRTAWAGEEFDWSGPCFQGRGLRVTPRPAQRGGVPLWLGGYAPAAVRRAGELADGYLIGRGDPGIVSTTAQLLEEVRPSADPGFTVGVNLLVALTGTPHDDIAFRAGFAHQQRVYEQIQRGREVFAGHVDTPHDGESLDVDRYLHAVGDAEEVARQVIEALAPLHHRANLHVVIRALAPQVDLAGQVSRVQRLGADLLPILRTHLGSGAAPGTTTDDQRTSSG